MKMQSLFLASALALCAAACGKASDRPAEDPSVANAASQSTINPATSYGTTSGAVSADPSTTTKVVPGQSTGTATTDTSANAMATTPNYDSTPNSAPSTTPAQTTAANSQGRAAKARPGNTQGPSVAPTPPPAADPVATTPPGGADQTAAATNTKINDRDRHGSTLTPIDQGNSKDELRITQAIRKGVMGDKGLSFNAKNVKIITVGTKVTLRGPVATDAEKASIESRAKATPGVTEVDDQIEVKK